MSKRWGRMVITLAILAGFYLLLGRGSAAPSLLIGETAVEITGGKAADYSVTVPYAEIRGILLLEEWEEGTLLAGGSEQNLHWGSWQNQAYGAYTLCIDPSIHRYLLFQTDAGAVVFNVESASATAEAYKAFTELLGQPDEEAEE